ncbi:MAG: M48 family metalloprotease [Massilia sp.]
MNDEEFGWLVSRLETQSANAPAAFRARVLLISCAAYIVLFLFLLVNLLVMYWGYAQWRAHGLRRNVITIGVLGLMSVPVFYVTLRTLLTRLPAPEGRAISAAEAPLLFDLLDKMRAKLQGPPIHHVLVDAEFNASIAQLPRWGLFGPTVNYLVLGLPFMLGHPTSEMMATVAHEYGHLCGAHGKIQAWIYRQRQTLGAIFEQLENAGDEGLGSGAMARALRAFMPYFYAYTFVLSRQDEYEADRAAGTLVGVDTAAASLIRSTLCGRWFYQHFWRTLYRQASTREKPAFMPYQSMSTAFRMSHDEWAGAASVKAAWEVESNVADTHPCLRERVEALGRAATMLKPMSGSSAASLLGAFGDRLIAEFDQKWWRVQEKTWAERYRYVRRSTARMAELAAVPMTSMALSDLQEMALLKAEFDSPQAAKPALEHLLRQPGGPFPKAACTYGRILLEEDRHEGLEHLATAARSDKRLADEALRTGFLYLLDKRGEDSAREWCDSVMRQAA